MCILLNTVLFVYGKKYFSFHLQLVNLAATDLHLSFYETRFLVRLTV